MCDACEREGEGREKMCVEKRDKECEKGKVRLKEIKSIKKIKCVKKRATKKV